MELYIFIVDTMGDEEFQKKLAMPHLSACNIANNAEYKLRRNKF